MVGRLGTATALDSSVFAFWRSVFDLFRSIQAFTAPARLVTPASQVVTSMSVTFVGRFACSHARVVLATSLASSGLRMTKVRRSEIWPLSRLTFEVRRRPPHSALARQRKTGAATSAGPRRYAVGCRLDRSVGRHLPSRLGRSFSYLSRSRSS
jgi:hypothetical protein